MSVPSATDALQEWFDEALDDLVSEQVASLVGVFLDNHWRSFFDLAQEHYDGVVERAEEALRELALPSFSADLPPVSRAGRSQKSDAYASTAADRTVFFQGLVDQREEARALKEYGRADVIEEQLDRNSVTVNRAERSWSSGCGLKGPVPSPISQAGRHAAKHRWFQFRCRSVGWDRGRKCTGISWTT